MGSAGDCRSSVSPTPVDKPASWSRRGGTLVKERTTRRFPEQAAGVCEEESRRQQAPSTAHRSSQRHSGHLEQSPDLGQWTWRPPALFTAAPSLAPSPFLLRPQHCFLGPRSHHLPLRPQLIENLDLTMTSLSCSRANVQDQHHGPPQVAFTLQHVLVSSSLTEVTNDLVPKLGTEMR